MFQKYRKVILLFLIVLIAWFLRFDNVNWDSGFHLHPDERFLTMVSTSMKLPANLNEYFNQKISQLNPTNIGYKFFVYGDFPLIINKYLAVFLKMDNYDLITILGRQLSAFFDLLIVLLVFKTVFLLEKKLKLSPNIKYWSAFIYGISVLPIQLSHFFTTDTFLNFFIFGSFYFSLRKKNILSAVFFGIAIACKVTALFILPLNLFLLFKDDFLKKQTLSKIVLNIVLFFLVSYLSLRISNPYYFQNYSFFNFTLSNDFISGLQSLKAMSVININNWYPPNVQWLNKNSVIHSVVNNVVFGFGIISTVFLIIGIFNFQFSIFNKFSKIKKQIFNNIELFIINLWIVGFFVYQSLQATTNLRYFIFLYPFFSIFAGIGIYTILNRFRRNKFILNTLYFILFASLMIWPIMFSSIYFHKHTRVEASGWIYKNLPSGSIILGESWDDPLPLSVPNTYGKQFTIEQLPVFDPDTSEKWPKMNSMLANADYYVLSSNRGWGSIPTVPQKYPLMSKFYNDLLANRNPEYKKIKEFDPYYYRFFILPNYLVDESFTVYDHPQVMIFKNEKNH